MLNRIVLLDEGGAEMFSGFSIASEPPPALDPDACPPTMRSVAPPPTTKTNEESGIFVRSETDDADEPSEKKVDEHAA